MVHIHHSVHAIDVEPSTRDTSANVDLALVVTDEEFDLSAQNTAPNVLDRHAGSIDSCGAVIARTGSSNIGEVADANGTVLSQNQGGRNNRKGKRDKGRHT
jgi:hypothetical protein